jgi:hypothetical protein
LSGWTNPFHRPRVEARLHAGGILQFMSDVTRILSAIEAGDPLAAEQLLPLVYDELRKLAGDGAGARGVLAAGG